MFCLDSQACFSVVNRAFELVCGCNRDIIVGKDFSFVFNDDAQFRSWKNLLTAGSGPGSSLVYMTRLLDAHGQERAFNVSIQPLINDCSIIEGFTGTCHDIGRILEAEYEKINALSFVVSGLAHEINTPMGNSIAMASFLLHSINQAEGQILANTMSRGAMLAFFSDARESCVSINDNLARGARLIESFKKLTAYREVQEPESIAVYEELLRIFAQVHTRYPKQEAKLELAISSGLEIWNDRQYFEEIFEELFRNSFEHGFSVSQEGLVRIQASAPDLRGKIRLIYSDTGRGLREVSPSNAMTPFFSRELGAKHSGLGFNMIYNLVRTAFSGDLVISEDQGTGFEMVLILSQEA